MELPLLVKTPWNWQGVAKKEAWRCNHVTRFCPALWLKATSIISFLVDYQGTTLIRSSKSSLSWLIFHSLIVSFVRWNVFSFGSDCRIPQLCGVFQNSVWYVVYRLNWLWRIFDVHLIPPTKLRCILESLRSFPHFPSVMYQSIRNLRIWTFQFSCMWSNSPPWAKNPFKCRQGCFMIQCRQGPTL